VEAVTAGPQGDAPSDDGQRVDKWLWYARVFKARERAARFVEEGRLRLAHPGGAPERVAKPSQRVRPGDILTFVQGHTVRVLRVEAAGHRRGPAAEAQRLYTELADKGQS
jgi:ribosome-associated heat shock protein Hsp15